MEIWQIWIVAALVLIIIEIFTSGFAIACLCVGCLLAAICAGFELSIAWQFGFFALGTFFGFIFVRPFVLKLMKMKKVMFVLAVAGMFAFAACNNNAAPAEEENAEQQEVVEAPVEENATEEATDAEVNTEDVAAEETPAADIAFAHRWTDHAVVCKLSAEPI